MMIDPQLQGAPIVIKTVCRVGGHAFIWSGVEGSAISPEHRCECGSYSYRQWAEVRKGAS